jgi:DNA polymerase-3 subunit epsilon
MSREPAGHLAALIDELRATGRYRVLERLEPRPHYHTPDGTDTRWALFVDVETTGLDAATDAIIELAALPFEFDPKSGRIFRVDPALAWLEDPQRPIPSRVVELTGITDAMVAGQCIDDAAVAALLDRTVLVIAHNAGFDRAFLERRLPRFADAYWACSQRDIPWDDEGVKSHSLEWIVYQQSAMFFDGHRADADCTAGVHVLATRLPRSGTPAMLALLESARAGSWRVYAERSPFESKEALKRRRYRWDAERKTWWREISGLEKDAEAAWLAAEVYGATGGQPRWEKVDPKRRFVRADAPSG